MRSSYAMVRDSRRRGLWSTVAVILMFCAVSLSAAGFLKAAYDDTRQDFMRRLVKEKEALDRNMQLKTELVAITQTRYVELRARERLGLKKPKEEEILVVR